MAEPNALATLRAELLEELTGHLLPYWSKHTLDERFGGFVGQITQNGEVVPEAIKGSVLNARILWTFSAAYRLLGEACYRDVAARAFDYFNAHFWDDEHEGVFWSLEYRGQPCDTRKQTYAQAFGLYGMTEYYRATGDEAALQRAIRLFHCIENYSFDAQHGGYLEAFGRAWNPVEDMRLSEKDLNAPKNMNTHLHVLEAYTTLYRVWPDPLLRKRLAMLIAVFLHQIIDDKKTHLHSFFYTDWTPMAEMISFGHDIEASWLLLEAAEVLGDPALRAQVRETAITLARQTHQYGQDNDGGLFYEAEPDGTLDTDKHWWPQAEAIVGFLNAYQETSEEDFLHAALAAWTFTKRHVIDQHRGEWFGRLTRAGVPYDDEDKVGLWKCPYHNARACLEVIERTASVSKKNALPRS